MNHVEFRCRFFVLIKALSLAANRDQWEAAQVFAKDLSTLVETWMPRQSAQAQLEGHALRGLVRDLLEAAPAIGSARAPLMEARTDGQR